MAGSEGLEKPGCALGDFQSDQQNRLNPLKQLLMKAKAAGLSEPVLDKLALIPPRVAALLADLKIVVRPGLPEHDWPTKTIYVEGDPTKPYGHPAAIMHEIGHYLHHHTGFVTRLRKKAIDRDVPLTRREVEARFGILNWEW